MSAPAQTPVWVHGASGMLAGEHIHEKKAAEGFDARLRASSVVAELHKVRNIRPAFHKGLWRGFLTAGIETLTGGRLKRTLKNHEDHAALKRVGEFTAPDNAQIAQHDALFRQALGKRIT